MTVRLVSLSSTVQAMFLILSFFFFTPSGHHHAQKPGPHVAVPFPEDLLLLLQETQLQPRVGLKHPDSETHTHLNVTTSCCQTTAVLLPGWIIDVRNSFLFLKLGGL